MSLEFIGRQANDLGEYFCSECETQFEIRGVNWRTAADYLEPKFCPACASPALPREEK